MKILIVQSKGIPPANTGQGTSIIQYALINGLVAENFEVGYLLISGERRFAENQPIVRQNIGGAIEKGLTYYERSSKNFKEDLQHFSKVYNEFSPDVCVVYQYEGIKLVREACPGARIIAVTIDLEFLPKIMRLMVHLRYDRPLNKLRWLLQSPWILKDAFKRWRKTIKYYPLADAHINHASHHASWIKKKFRKPVLYTPNPVDTTELPVPERKIENLPQPRRFVLLGGLKGVATLSGLYFFAEKVLPLLQQNIQSKQIEIRLIGRDKLDGKLAELLRSGGVVECGFVPDLAEEMGKATAMLVPTEITLGFRTRILDAFRYRLAVLAHSSNKLGFPELEHDRNCLLADNAKDYAAMIQNIATSPPWAIRLGEQAFEDFNERLNSVANATKISSWVKTLFDADQSRSANKSPKTSNK